MVAVNNMNEFEKHFRSVLRGKSGDLGYKEAERIVRREQDHSLELAGFPLNRPGGPSLFAFVLHSNRASHDIVGRFTKAQFPLLNELAVRTNMWVYCFRYTKTNIINNPAAEIAGVFDVDIKQLPGVLIFTDFPGRGLFFPLALEHFDDSRDIEARLIRLFDLINGLRRRYGYERTIEVLERELPKWKTYEKMQPFIVYIAKQASRLRNLPSEFARKYAEGLAKGIMGDPE